MRERPWVKNPAPNPLAEFIKLTADGTFTFVPRKDPVKDLLADIDEVLGDIEAQL
jgi:hypothetical protein